MDNKGSNIIPPPPLPSAFSLANSKSLVINSQPIDMLAQIRLFNQKKLKASDNKESIEINKAKERGEDIDRDNQSQTSETKPIIPDTIIPISDSFDSKKQLPLANQANIADLPSIELTPTQDAILNKYIEQQQFAYKLNQILNKEKILQDIQSKLTQLVKATHIESDIMPLAEQKNIASAVEIIFANLSALGLLDDEKASKIKKINQPMIDAVLQILCSETKNVNHQINILQSFGIALSDQVNIKFGLKDADQAQSKIAENGEIKKNTNIRAGYANTSVIDPSKIIKAPKNPEEEREERIKEMQFLLLNKKNSFNENIDNRESKKFNDSNISLGTENNSNFSDARKKFQDLARINPRFKPLDFANISASRFIRRTSNNSQDSFSRG